MQIIELRIEKILNANSLSVLDDVVMKKYHDFKLVLRDIERLNVDMNEDYANICRKLLVQAHPTKIANTHGSLCPSQKEFCDLVSKDSDTLFSGVSLTASKIKKQLVILRDNGSLGAEGNHYQPCSLDPNLIDVFDKLDSGIQAIHVTGADLLSLRVLQTAFDTAPFLTILAANHNICKILTLSFFLHSSTDLYIVMAEYFSKK